MQTSARSSERGCDMKITMENYCDECVGAEVRDGVDGFFFYFDAGATPCHK